MTSKLDLLLKEMFVPVVEEGDDRPVMPSDFAQYKSKINVKFLFLTEILVTDCSLDDTLVSQIVVICGQHSIPGLWTTDVTLHLADSVRKTVIGNPTMYFQKSGALDRVLALIRPALGKTEWKKNPACVVALAWIVLQFDRTLVSSYFKEVIPFILTVSDDFEHHNIILGLRCLAQLTKHTTSANLACYGYDGVINSLLTHTLWRNEEDLIKPILSCFGVLMSKAMEKNELRRNMYDDFLDVVLQQMQMEGSTVRQKNYLEMMPDLVKRRGIGFCHHSNVWVILESAVNCHETSLLGLNMLKTIIEVLWPRQSTYYEPALKYIFQFIYLTTSDNRLIDCEEINTLRSIASYLCAIKPDSYNRFYDHLLNEPTFSDSFKVTIQSALDPFHFATEQP